MWVHLFNNITVCKQFEGEVKGRPQNYTATWNFLKVQNNKSQQIFVSSIFSLLIYS